MVQKFSPSALHHGSVHGCFSARADLFIQKAPTNKVKMRLQTKVSYRSTGTQFSQSSLGGRTATKRPKAGRAVNERLGTVSHGNRKDYFSNLCPFLAIPSPLELLYLCSLYANRPAKMCSVRQLCGYLPDGGDFHRFAEEPGLCQWGRMRRMLYLFPRHEHGEAQSHSGARHPPAVESLSSEV